MSFVAVKIIVASAFICCLLAAMFGAAVACVDFFVYIKERETKRALLSFGLFFLLVSCSLGLVFLIGEFI